MVSGVYWMQMTAIQPPTHDAMKLQMFHRAIRRLLLSLLQKLNDEFHDRLSNILTRNHIRLTTHQTNSIFQKEN